MAIGAGMSCVKYLLFSFNLLFAITGLIILIVGIKSEINAHPYVDLTDESFYTSAPVILIIVGLIVFIVAFFGCCGAVKENHCMIVTFSVFLLLIFIAEMAVGIAGYVKHKDLETSISRSLNESITHYYTDPNVKKNYDIIQTDLRCCGIYGYDDWSRLNQSLPSSCCDVHAHVTDAPPAAPAPPTPPAPTCTVVSPDLHHDGCLPIILTRLQEIALLLGGVGLGIALVQLLGVIFACCLARSIRSQYETV